MLDLILGTVREALAVAGGAVGVIALASYCLELFRSSGPGL